jgi:4-amino-4-deoxy-L-arabinose transferase-like glycosyltransferase
MILSSQTAARRLLWLRMAVWLRTHKVEVLVFLGAFLIRAVYAVIIQIKSGSHGFIAFSDAEYFYYTAAKNLLQHHVFSIAQSAPYYPDAFHTPLYPAFIAGLLWLKAPLFCIVLIQDLFAAATVSLLYRIALTLSRSYAIALTAAILASLEPMSIYWSGLLMTDIFFAFWMTMSFYLLIREKTLGAAITLGLATLIRPIGLYFSPIFALFICYKLYKKGKTPKTMVQNGALFLIAFAVVVSPWFVRNKIDFNTWSLTSAGWYDIYYYPVSAFAAERGIAQNARVIDTNGDKEFTRFGFQYAPYFKSESLAVIHDNLLTYLVFQIKRSFSSFFSNRYEYLLQVIIKSELPGIYAHLPAPVLSLFLRGGEVFWLIIYTLVCAALFSRKHLYWWVFFAVLVCINALISGGINPGGTDMSRYALPFYAFFFTFAGIGYANLFNALSSSAAIRSSR